MQQGIQKALLKGPDAAIKFFDEQNPTFQLEREGNRVFQVNEDGSRQVFIDARSPQDLAMQLEARATPGGMLQLAKFNLDSQTAKSQQAYYDARITALQSDDRRASQQMIGAQTVVTRDANGREIQAIQGLRFNRASGEMETVSIPLGDAGVPLSALDPKRIDELADLLVDTPVDPSNKRGPKHTMASARQAARDSIVNSYLGEPTGLDRDAGGESPEAIERIRQAAAQEEQATDESDTTQPRTAMTRGEARQNARVRAELNQQFEALPEVQAMIQQLKSDRAGLRRGGREDTRALSAQIAQMREQFIAERMGLRPQPGSQ